MKIKATISALVIAAALLASTVYAGTVTAIPSTTAASGTSVVIAVDGPNRWNVQACGTGFSGAVLVWSGESAATLSLKHTWTLTTDSTCNAHYSFDPAGFAKITFTRTAGTLDSVVIRYFPEKP